MARKRRTKFTWLPNTGTTGPAADVQDTTNGRDFGVVSVPANGTTALAIVDLVLDDAAEDVTTGPIGVILTSEYFIKRIVGKWFISADQSSTANLARNILVGAGLFVARAEDTDSAGGLFLPIGALTQAQAVDNYSPLRQETVREPWIWRRTWILSNLLTTANGVNFPQSTAEYGSVLDGPHCDAKTARRVGNDERLWGVVAVRNYPLNTTNDAGGTVRSYFDYRVLGASRRARGRSAF